MNTFTFDDIVSKKDDPENYTRAEFKAAVTDEMMDKFLEISGDDNPLHRDSTFATDKGFRDRVVYGMLTASFYSRLAGVYLPGRNCILHSVESSFHAPVFVGDELTVSGFVKVKYESTRVIEVSAKIVNQDGTKVGKAKILAGVLE